MTKIPHFLCNVSWTSCQDKTQNIWAWLAKDQMEDIITRMMNLAAPGETVDITVASEADAFDAQGYAVYWQVCDALGLDY